MLVAPSASSQHDTVSPSNHVDPFVSPNPSPNDMEALLDAPVLLPGEDNVAPPSEDTNAPATAVNGVQDAPLALQPAFDFPDLANTDIKPDLNNAQLPDLNANALDTTMMDADMVPMEMPLSVPTDERLTAYARLRFDDGSYYMHTYQVILGRNIALAHRDQRRLAKVEQLEAEGHKQAAEALLHGKKAKKKRRDRKGARSVISEGGGIVTASIESMPVEYQQRRQSNASHSQSSASHPNGDSGEEKPTQTAPQDMIMQALPEVPAQFDIPENPHDCPVVPIHPQHITAATGVHGPKGISRQHAKIFYDFDNGHFSVEVLGSNGLYHENEYTPRGEIVPLNHGDHLLIGAVSIQFFLPDVALDEGQEQGTASRPMSFSFENGHGELESDEEMSSDSGGEQSVNPQHLFHYPIDSSISSDDFDEDDEGDEYEEPVARSRQKPSIKLKLKTPSKPEPEPEPAPKHRSKDWKKAHKRKHRDITPEEVPVKKVKVKTKETPKEVTKESKASKEPKEIKEPKEKGKAPAKIPSKVPVKVETPVEEPIKDSPAKETPAKEKSEPTATVPTDSPPLLRKPLEGELEAGEIEGLITEEMARQYNLPSSLIGQVVEKRKGPGRPPKDGIMSKRQRSQLVKQAKEIERAKAAGIDPADIPAPTFKPKPPKRKESNAADGDEDDILETTEKTDGTISGDKKQTKPTKPARTPSPEMRIEDYTEEQLQRPTANYVVLIHEAISSSSTGQMNLQQIYNYIERKYPWYKFKTSTTGWQSSVRHNLGQHDAFMKGDKEGKGYNWKINHEVSIEKERRKRQVSPPMNHAQRQPYYPSPNGYPPYPQGGYPYHPGMPHSMPPAAPRPPPSLAQPRLPPSMRDANASTPAIPHTAPQHASPYASPWAGGGNTAGTPSTPSGPPRPSYPMPSAPAPPANQASASGGYGVLYPTSAPQAHSGAPAPSPYAGPYGSGPSPYAAVPPRPYPTQPTTQGQAPTNGTAQTSASPYAQSPYGPPPPGPPNDRPAPHPSGRYPLSTHPDLIRQLEAFREVYLKARHEPGEDKKVDNAIRACVDITVPEATLTQSEKLLLSSLCSIEGVAKHRPRAPEVKMENKTATPPVSAPATSDTLAAGTAAAIAADAVVAQQQPVSGPQPQVPVSYAHPTSGTTQQPAAIPPQQQPAAPAQQQAPASSQQSTPLANPAKPPGDNNVPGNTTQAPAPLSSLPSLHRPSVEPLTPVPGSPAVGAPNSAAQSPLVMVTNGDTLKQKIEDEKPQTEAVAAAPVLDTKPSVEDNKEQKET